MGEPNRRFSFPNLVRRLPQIWRGRPAEVERPQTSTLRNENAQATRNDGNFGTHDRPLPNCPPPGIVP
ncbi:unnamed protein product [Adineta steineri]|uniref:Uncharacterized protein n=1 Tax=Adineta steineri TaxID=433720 RepID=A0A819RN00_9BILA|nr:unnamed protein product [Adineta steineri]